MSPEITQSDMQLMLSGSGPKDPDRARQGQDIQQASTGCIAVRVADYLFWTRSKPPTADSLLLAVQVCAANDIMIQPLAPSSARVWAGSDWAGLTWWHGTVYQE